MVRGLGPQHLRAKIGTGTTNIDGVTAYQGATRVLLLIDQDLVDNNETWPAVHQLAGDLIRFARPDTSFALQVLGKGSETKLPFGEPREKLLQALDDSSVMKNHRGRIVDAIVESLDMFGSTQPGDVLYVMTNGVDESSHNNADSMRKAVLASGVRLFAIYFRQARPSPGAAVVINGTVPFAPGIEPWNPRGNDPIGLVDTVEHSGGIYTNVLPAVGSSRYELHGAHLEELQKAAAANYRIMTQFYLVRLKDKATTGQTVNLELADPKLAAMTLVYPREAAGCRK